MLILAIDTALDACSAAVLDTDASKIVAQESQPMKRGHAEALMPLIARVMKASTVAFASLDRIAVTTGPGSFTGLRVGLSAARGIALAAGKPVVGLTTLTAYAAPIVTENGPHPIISAIDARHDHVYFQVVGGAQPRHPGDIGCCLRIDPERWRRIRRPALGQDVGGVADQMRRAEFRGRERLGNRRHLRPDQ
jgi:tRNA threonylcarbamoyl adenosine modification protein YeaZ